MLGKTLAYEQAVIAYAGYANQKAPNFGYEQICTSDAKAA